MEIRKGNAVIIGSKDLVEKNGNITCACENPSLTMVCHIDGQDFYSYTYKCDCGNVIEMQCKRTGLDKELWS